MSRSHVLLMLSSFVMKAVTAPPASKRSAVTPDLGNSFVSYDSYDQQEYLADPDLYTPGTE